MSSTSAKEISSLLLSKASPSFLNRVRVPLYTGGTTAVLASVCCIGPFFLVVPGISSSTILYLITPAEWARPVFIVVAMVSLLLSYQRIWSSVPIPESRAVGASSQAKMVVYKIFFIIITILVVAILMLPNIDFSTE